MENITLIVAIIGCVTGVGSLLINFYKVLKERPKLEIEVIRPYSNGFVYNKSTNFTTEHILVLSIRLINIGPVPIAIKTINVIDEDCLIYTSDRYKLNYIELDHGDNKTSTSLELLKPIDFPYVLESGRICETTLIYPLADNLYKSYTDKKIDKVKLKVNTVYSSKSLEINVYKINYKNYLSLTEKIKQE